MSKKQAPRRVRITKCSFPQGWYAGDIGKEFDVDNASPPKDYVLWEDFTHRRLVWRYIAQEDCIIVSPAAPEPERADLHGLIEQRVAYLKNLEADEIKKLDGLMAGTIQRTASTPTASGTEGEEKEAIAKANSCEDWHPQDYSGKNYVRDTPKPTPFSADKLAYLAIEDESYISNLRELKKLVAYWKGKAQGLEESADHAHVQLPSGAIANVSPDASPELLGALDQMCELAAKMPDEPETFTQWLEKKVEEIGSPWGSFNAGIRTGAREAYAYALSTARTRISGEEKEPPADILEWINAEAGRIANEPIIHEFQAARVGMIRMWRRLQSEWDKEPLNMLLANALRRLSEDQMTSLADALYERTSAGSGVRARISEQSKEIASLTAERNDYRAMLERIVGAGHAARGSVLNLISKYTQTKQA